MKKSEQAKNKKATATKSAESTVPQNKGKQGRSVKRKRGKRVETVPQQPRQVQRKRRSWWKRLSRRDRMIFIAPALAAVIVGLVVMFVEVTAEQMELPDVGVRYYAGSRFYMDEGTVLRRTSDDTTIAVWEDGEYTLDTLPIYYENENTVLFANSVVYVEPRMDLTYSLDYFTAVHVDSGGSIYAQRDGDEVFLTGGFAFDGQDTYVFFDTVVLEFNGYRMELPPLSYVKAAFTGDITVYNSGASEQYIEALTTDVIIKLSGADFELSLLEDCITNADGSKRLLFVRPDLLDGVF